MKSTEKVEKQEKQEPKSVVLGEVSEMGEIRIHENVISSIVRKTALVQDGVSRLAGSTLVDNIAEIVGSRRMQDRSILINMEQDNRVSIDIKLNVKFGFKVPVVATAVQKAVTEEVESLTGMNVTKVNVIVQEIEEDEPVESAEDAPGVAGVPPLI